VTPTDTAPALAAGAPRPKADRSTGRRRKLTGLALTLPALVAIGLTTLFPILHTVWLSLNGPNTALRGTPDFKGLANYGRIIKSLDFQRALTQTIGLVATSLLLELVIGMAVALALHRGLKGTRLFRAIIAMPLMVAPVVGALAWRFVFVDGYGMIDSLMNVFGLQAPLWFADVWLARVTIITACLWMALPFDVLVLLAGLASLPTEPLEAARVDGASERQIFVNITLPLLRPVIAVILVVRLADAFRVFDVVYVLTTSGPANSTDVLSTFIYRQMFTVFDFPGGAAAAVMLVLITAFFSLIAVAALRSRASGG
jgi:multiple sugar transport system permease protein